MHRVALTLLLSANTAQASDNTYRDKTPLFEYQTETKSTKKSYYSSDIVKIPVEANNKKLIDTQKGTLAFTFTPNLKFHTPHKSPHTSTLFKLGELDNDFKIILYHQPDKTYLEFRHDAAENCARSQCQRSVSTSLFEPSIVNSWRPGEPHHIIASWNFRTDNPEMDLYIDGRFAINQTKSPNIGYPNFNPRFIYINGDNHGNIQAEGIISDLRIFEDEFLSPPNKINEYINWRKGNGIREDHELNDSYTEITTPKDSRNTFLINYTTAPFQKVFEGSPVTLSNSEPIEFKMMKNECETRFFNLYSGFKSQLEIKVNITDLMGKTKSIMAKDIEVRTTHNWWQASNSGVMKTKLPSYTPELLVFDEVQFSDWMSNPKNLPDNQNNGIAHANINPGTSKQFSIRICLPQNAAAGSYIGEIFVKAQSEQSLRIPVKLTVADAILPKLSSIAAIYHESRFDISPHAANYVTANTYENQLKNIRQHGFNGLIAYGDDQEYIHLAKRNGLDSFFCFSSTRSISDKIKWLKGSGYSPVFLGEDEAHLYPERLHAHIRTTAMIHRHGGLVAAATDKKQENSLRIQGSKLDIPILDLESKLNPEHHRYIEDLLLNGRIENQKNELIYWQATNESPLKNRFYAGYFLYLTNFGGIAPYVFQKVRGNPFDDFSDHSGKERSLHLAYPSKQGPIDTLQWEALREGLDDYRLLTQVTHIIEQKEKTNPKKVHSIKSELTQLLAKYKNMEAYQTAIADQFDSDRKKLIRMIMVLIDKETEH